MDKLTSSVRIYLILIDTILEFSDPFLFNQKFFSVYEMQIERKELKNDVVYNYFKYCV